MHHDTNRLAPSMALALRAACGVRVGNPANAVGFCLRQPRNDEKQ
ncbi:MAG: hypothetical protein OJF55_002954 [Rhodanobacteraceae bacterium]|nr:MAG: hypothetical protein OJF55_002954 [Rhodanobacteraceae bacterium]